MPNIVRRAIGPNDAGIPEDQVMDIIIPLRLPAGTVLRCCQTGDSFDSDGRKLEVQSQNTASHPRLGLPQ